MKNPNPKSPLATAMLAAMVLLAGCGESGAPGEAPADTTANTPVPAATPASESNVPPTITPDIKSSAEPMAAAEFDKAEWTRNACSLNTVNGAAPPFVADHASPLELTGYLIDETGGVPGEFLIVFKQGDAVFTARTTTGVARPDVAEFFKNPALEKAGFQALADVAALEAGTYEVKFLIDRGERSFFCEAEHTIELK